MNVAVYAQMVIAGREGEYGHYDAMRRLSMETLGRNLGGLDTLDTVTVKGKVPSWEALLRHWYDHIKGLHGEGNAVMLVGSDTLLLAPVDYNWEPGHMVMPMSVGRAGGFRNNCWALFPAGMDKGLWEIGDRAWKKIAGDQRHDPDQYVYNEMYNSQPPETLHGDIGYGGAPKLLDSDDTNGTWRHYSASRDPEGRLAMMQRDYRAWKTSTSTR